jgi:hypothetical protein
MKIYKTKDFYLACSFIANDIQLIDSKKDGENTVFFLFNYENSDIINQIVADFINCNCIVNVKKFTYAIKILRDEIKKYK